MTHFSCISIIGPRLSGKTTLVKSVFQNIPYVCLDDLDERELALNNPQAFLQRFKDGAVIDDIHHAPQLYLYILEQTSKTGPFILCGSPSQVLMKTLDATQGKVLKLLPLSYQELQSHNRRFDDPYEVIFNGFYPAIYKHKINPTLWFKNLLNTYLECEVRKFKSVSDLIKFRVFLRCCAERVGQVMNMSAIASACGVNHKTIKSWLSILESSYLIFFLTPHSWSFNKRLVRQPKLYFYDTGLACYLLGLKTHCALLTHPMREALFENFVIKELIKSKYNQGQEHNLFFWRDNHGHEIDVLAHQGDKVIPIAIHPEKLIKPDSFKGLTYWKHLSGQSDAFLIYAGNTNQSKENTSILSWKEPLAS